MINIFDLLLALAAYTVVNGFVYLNGDTIAFLPYHYLFDGEELFGNDIRYSELPNIAYGVSYYLEYALGKIFNPLWANIILIISTVIVLLISIKRIVKHLGGYNVPYSVIIIFFLGYYHNNLHLMAGNHFSTNMFSSHYTAISLSLFAVSFFFAKERITFPVIIFHTMATMLNLRVGVFGFSLTLLFFICSNKNRFNYYVAFSAVLLAIAAIVFIDYRDTGVLNQTARILTFFRSPAHLLPTIWAGYIYLNCFFVGTFFIFLYMKKPEFRSILFTLLICFSGIIINIINNIYAISPFLTLINLFQYSTFILIFFYIFLIILLMNKLEERYYLSTLSILFAPNLQIRIAFLIIFLIFEYCTKNYNLSPIIIKNAKRRDICVFSIQVVAYVLFYFFRKMPSYYWVMRIDNINIYIYVIFMISLLIVIYSAFRKISYQSIYLLLFAICLPTGIITSGNFSFFSRNHLLRQTEFSKEKWYDMCNYVKENTPTNSSFIIPPDKMSFQALSKRSGFCSYQNVPLNKNIIEWARRFKILNQISSNISFDNLNSRIPIKSSFPDYHVLTSEKIKRISELYPFVNYIIIKNNNLDFDKIYSNGKFTLYKLK